MKAIIKGEIRWKLMTPSETAVHANRCEGNRTFLPKIAFPVSGTDQHTHRYRTSERGFQRNHRRPDPLFFPDYNSQTRIVVLRRAEWLLTGVNRNNRIKAQPIPDQSSVPGSQSERSRGQTGRSLAQPCLCLQRQR